MALFRKIKKGIRTPQLLGRKMNQIYHSSLGRVSHNSNGIDVMNEDWDNLIILDACRYDMFEELNSIQGELRQVTSKGSSTVEFLNGNFSGGEYHDTVYITANPQLYRHMEDINVEFHEVLEVWQEEGWNDEYGTVTPDVVEQYAKKAQSDYPNKRLIIHYIQPHYPFIDFGKDQGKSMANKSKSKNTVWMDLMTGKQNNKEEVIDAYYDNLRLALESVQSLLKDLRGKSVISSDHGNMLGEPASPIPVREYGHPPQLYTDELVKIPWLEVSQSGDRPDISAELPTKSSSTTEDSVVQDRLENLGYV